MVKVTLKGGVVREYEAGTSCADIAKSIGAGLYKSACAARIDGEACDLLSLIHIWCASEPVDCGRG